MDTLPGSADNLSSTILSWVTGFNIPSGCAEPGSVGFKWELTKDFVIISRVFSAAHQLSVETASTLHNHSSPAALFSPFCNQGFF